MGCFLTNYKVIKAHPSICWDEMYRSSSHTPKTAQIKNKTFFGVESVEKKIGEEKKKKKHYFPEKVRHGTTVCIDPESLTTVQQSDYEILQSCMRGVL